jgi:chemotaxis protein MotB
MAKKEPPPAEGAPLWMCTYGDLMSLLLCFFIMLFAISTIAEIRYQALADTLSQDFTGYPGSSKTKARQTRTTMVPADSAARSRRTLALLGGQPSPGPVGESRDVHTILLDGETVKGGVTRFELGNYELTEQARENLRALLPTLQGSPQKIMVKGYTAPVERGRAAQQDTDLAFYRATSAVDYLVSLGLKRDFFEIVVDPGTVPRLNLLPPGTAPEHAGASVEIILLHQTVRSLK